MKYVVTVEGHDPLSVEVANQLRLPKPAANLAEARSAIAQGIAASVLPKLHDLGPSKELERDGSGQITIIRERPAMPANVLAAQVGWQVAGRVLEGAEE